MKTILTALIIAAIVTGCKKTTLDQNEKQLTFINCTFDTVHIFTGNGSAFQIMPNATILKQSGGDSQVLYGFNMDIYNNSGVLKCSAIIDYSNMIKY